MIKTFYTICNNPGSLGTLWKRTTKLLLLAMLPMLSFQAFGQTTVTIGTGTAADYFYGPIYRSSAASAFDWSNYDYLYTATELAAAGIPNGALITNVEFFKNDGFSITNTGNAAFNLYLKNSAATQLVSGTTWGTALTGATLALTSTYNNTAAYPASPGNFITAFTTPASPNWQAFAPTAGFVYTGGALEVLTSWDCSAVANNPTDGAFNWQYSTYTGNIYAIGVADGAATGAASVLTTTYGGANRPNIRITYLTPPACAGTPTAGTAASSANPVCPSTDFTLSLTGTTVAGGLTYQWQVFNSGSWFNIPGATNSVYTYTGGITSTQQFRCVVTCPGNGSSNSTPVTVTVNSFLNCYCTSNATSAADEEILNVTVGSLNNSSTCTTIAPGPGSVLNMYSNYKSGTGAPAAPNLDGGNSIPFSIEVGTCGGNYGNSVKIYIDYNMNGLFTDPGENVYAQAASITGPHTETGTFTVPISVLSGATVMRVVCVETLTPADINPCGTYIWGETEDYLVNLVAAAPCVNPPTPGTVSVSPATPCPSTNFTLSLSGNSIGTGQTYQWQYFDTGTSTWTNIAGATNTAYTVVGGITASTQYRCEVICSGGAAVYAGPATVTLNNFMNCYCTSNATFVGDDEIFNVTVGTLNNSSTCTSLGTGPGSILNQYANYRSGTGAPAAPNLDAGGSAVPFSVTIGQCSGTAYNAGFEIFIDYNQNGLFTDPGESVYGSPAAALAAVAGTAFTGTFNVPITATAGVTGMRVVAVEGGTGATINPCGTYNWGETEDYLVNIVPASPCVNPPTPGTVTVSPAVPCPSTSFTLTLSGNSIGLNQTYQWQYYNTGTSTWTNIVGATSSAYTVTGGITVPTDYRCEIICSGGAPVYAGPVTVNLNTFMNCYCVSNATSAAGEEILNVTVGSLNNSSTCTTIAPGPGSVLNMYSNYKSGTGAPAAPNLDGGNTIPFSIEVGTCGGNYGNSVKIYIDYNMNGLFTDPGENVYAQAASITGPHTETGTFTVPISVLSGSTVMRVVCVETTPANVNPCGTYAWGETEDYLVNLVAAAPCVNPPTPGTVSVSPATPCPSTNFTLTLAGNSMGIGQTYQWQYFDTGTSTWTNIVGANSTAYTVTGGITAARDYRCEIVCSGGTPVQTPPVTVTLNTFTNCYCNSNATATADDEIFNVTVGTLNNSSTCTSLGTGPGSILNQYANYRSGTGAPAAPNLDAGGSAVPFSVTIGQCNTGAYNAGFEIFIDYNQNGLFTDPGESVYGSPVAALAAIAGTAFTGSFNVPVTATGGLTGMRVVAVEGGTGATINPCGTYTWGETEDYLVNIVPAPPCTNPPTPGTTASTINPVCTNTAFTLSLTGASYGAGMTYQWQFNNAGTWTNIAGANTNTYTVASITASTEYRCELICSGGAAVYSTPLIVALSPATSCYCIPPHPPGCGNGNITNVTFNNINNTSTCANTNALAYTIYPNAAPTVTNVTQGVPYPLSVTTDQACIISVWFDWNQNGLFETTEWTQVATASTANTPASVSITPPVTATLGLTKMRIRSRFSGNINGAADPCTSFGSGESEDYFINVVAPIALDAQVNAMVTPAFACALSSNATVTVILKNNGTTTMAPGAGVVTLVASGANTGSYTASNTISLALGATQTLTFTGVNLSNAGLTNFTATVALAGDQDASNNSTSGSFTGLSAITTLPYNQDFEAGPAGWSTGGSNSSWALGTPAGTVINTAASGSNAWVTNLTGNYNSLEASYLYSPCFDFTSVSSACAPILSFSQTFQLEQNWDGTWVEYTTNGTTWTILGTNTSTGTGVLNWYNYTGNYNHLAAAVFGWNSPSATIPPAVVPWRTVSHPLPAALAGAPSVRFRIVLDADQIDMYEGVGIDNFAIAVPSADVGISAITPIASGCALSSTEPVTVTINNYGCSAVSNIPVTVSGAGTLTGTFTGTINPGATASFTLPGGLDLSTDGTYTINASTSLVGDASAVNDASPALIISNYSTASSPTITGNNILCPNGTTVLTGALPTGAQGTVTWYAGPVGGAPLGSGNTYTYTAPGVVGPTTVYAEANSGLRITEMCRFRTGTGATSPYPAWMTPAADDDLIELANLGSDPVNCNGYTLEIVGAGARVYGLPNITLNPGEVMVIHVGTGVDNPTNHYYHTGNNTISGTVTNNPWSSTSTSGLVLKNGPVATGVILDACANTATTGAAFTTWGTTGVTAAHWSGAAPYLAGRAGIVRVFNDTNTASDWVYSGTAAPNPLQTLGSLNPQLPVICPDVRVAYNMTVYNCCTGTPTYTTVPPVVPNGGAAASYTANNFCIDGNWVHYFAEDVGGVGGPDYLLLSLDLQGNPNRLGTFGAGAGTGGYNVGVLVVPAATNGTVDLGQHITQATTGSTSYPTNNVDWYIMNRSWEVKVNDGTFGTPSNGGLQPAGAGLAQVPVKFYYNDMDFTHINNGAVFTTPTHEDMTFYKLATGENNNPAQGHVGVDAADISLYTHAATASLTNWKRTAQPFATSQASDNSAELWVTTFSGGGGGSGSGGPFPVTNLAFSGYSSNGMNYLKWTTATETNNALFEVMASVDGISFTKIGEVNTKAVNGTSTSPLSYDFTDESPSAQVVYYRLKQIDIDGTSTLSNMIELHVSKDFFSVSEIYPNPTAKDLNFTINSAAQHELIIEIYDVAGRAVMRKTHISEGGSDAITFDVSQLAAGTYNLRIRSKTEDFDIAKRFVKVED